MIIGIIILLMVGLAIAVNVLRYFKVCAMGFHDEVDTEYFIMLSDIVKEEAKKLDYSIAKDSSRFSIFMYINFDGDKAIYDSVCVKCGECYNNIEEKRQEVKKVLLEKMKKKEEQDRKTKMATDLFNEKCRGNNDNSN